MATVHKLLMKVIVKTKFVLTKYKEFLLGLKCTPVWRSGSPPSSSQWNQTTSYLTRSHATLFNLSLRQGVAIALSSTYGTRVHYLLTTGPGKIFAILILQTG